MNIITITLNPAFDIHCHIDSFLPHCENLAKVTQRDAGGKGVNISRALTKNGVNNTALVVLGKENADEFCESLSSDGISFQRVYVPGRIRENITIHENLADETRISFTGFSADNALLERVENAISEISDKEKIVTFTGRLPDGIDMEAVRPFLGRIKEGGAKIVIDSRSFEMCDLIDCQPWLIKPNQEEISHYWGKEIRSWEQAADAAVDLHKQGIENVMISLGKEGALLVCEDGRFFASPPKISVSSTIGAGDSSIAGFLAATAEGKSAKEKLATAVAYGSAACMQKGTRPPQSEDILGIFKQISVQPF